MQRHTNPREGRGDKERKTTPLRVALNEAQNCRHKVKGRPTPRRLSRRPNKSGGAIFNNRTVAATAAAAARDYRESDAFDIPIEK
ncbi:hypothetical protein M0802_002987 [Mischocyttarus mexicanus]|nr:hypothetical protein M0802_002987 [Mischocyttarus mexicanus]